MYLTIILLSGLVFIFAFLTIVKDPTDPALIEERKCRLEGKTFDEQQYEYYCDKCDGHVDENSKHCRRCQRCTLGFDHHCIWLNNCIGYNNYRYFVVTIWLFTLQLILQGIFEGFLFFTVL
jgi:hypothetical protein